jgi:hypothetical protein
MAQDECLELCVMRLPPQKSVNESEFSAFVPKATANVKRSGKVNST